MNYQSTGYIYNQRSEILVPTRKGTTYHGVSNHKPLIAYQDVDTDIEFFIVSTDRKPENLQTKTFNAKVVDNDKTTVLNKSLIPFDYDRGIALLRITQSEIADITPGLYNIIITYTDNSGRTYGLHSDQNNRLSYVLEVRDVF
jgi:hypothetical protein